MPALFGAVAASRRRVPVALNWAPGYYVLSTEGASAAAKQEILDDPLTAPFTGVQFRYLWDDSEGAQGDYSAGFAELDADLANVAAAGMKLNVMLQYKTFDGTPAVPVYVRTEPAYESVSGNYTGEMIFDTTTHVAMVWNTAVNARLQAWVTAMVQHIAASQHASIVSCIVFNETSLGDPTMSILLDADYEGGAYIAALQSNLLMVTSVWGGCVAVYYHQGGFVDPDGTPYRDGSGDSANTIMSDWLSTHDRVGAGTPDAEPLNPHPTSYVLRRASTQGLFASVPNVQANDYGTDRTNSLQQSFDYMTLPDPDGLFGHYLVFSYADGSASPNAFTFADVSGWISTHPAPNTTIPVGW